MRQSTKIKAIKLLIKDFESRDNPFSEIVNSISCAKFIENTNQPYLASRDYLNVKMWDLRNPHNFV